MRSQRQAGLTLIELMVTMAVLLVLIGVGWNYYDGHRRKNWRVDGVLALAQAAQLQERFQFSNGSYSSDINSLDVNGDKPGNTSPLGHYTLSVATDMYSDDARFAESDCRITSGGLTRDFCYRLTAVSTHDGAKAGPCYKLTLDHTGLKKSYDSANNPTSGCWSK